jgi:hypothetical protein
MRLDSRSAPISIFTAATLHAIAPYAIIAWTIGGRTPVSTLAPMIAATIVTAMASEAIEKTGLRATAIRR